MKRTVSFVLTFLYLLLCMRAPAYAAQKEIPDFCKPILESWGATNAKELTAAILDYWEKAQPKHWKGLHKTIKKPVAIRFGGNTKQLIKDAKNWDIAIVSSKEVDMQKLLDAGVLIKRGASPCNETALYQWCLSEAVQAKLPQHELYYYAVYCYSYDGATDEAVFLVCNKKGRPLRATVTWAWQILARRTPEQVRAVEGISRTFDWERFAMPELSATQEELIEHPDAWDWAFLRVKQGEKLEKLDQAGLLYDFAQDEYWASRAPEWEAPNGLFSDDGRMIAIPYVDRIYDGAGEMSLFVVNAHSSVLSNALAYAKHYIKTYEWDDQLPIYYENPEIVKKYNDHSVGIFKKDIDW